MGYGSTVDVMRAMRGRARVYGGERGGCQSRAQPSCWLRIPCGGSRILVSSSCMVGHRCGVMGCVGSAKRVKSAAGRLLGDVPTLLAGAVMLALARVALVDADQATAGVSASGRARAAAPQDGTWADPVYTNTDALSAVSCPSKLGVDSVTTRRVYSADLSVSLTSH